MLYFSLFFAALLLAVAIWAVYRSAHPIITIVIAGFVCTFIAPIFVLVAFSAPVFWLAILLTAAAALCTWRTRRPRQFVVIALGAFATVFGVSSFHSWKEISGWIEQFPYASMDERLRSPASPGSLPQGIMEQLAAFEKRLEDPEQGSFRPARVYRLKALHEDTLSVFVNRPGFGVGRMMPFNEQSLQQGLRREHSISQPGPRTTPLVSTGDLHKEVRPAELSGTRKALDETHQSSLFDFINPAGFGYFKDRRHVAGFQEHQMSKTPESPNEWRLETVDLIGLVVHEEPVAYVTDNLPRMDELRKAPIRLLDEFESKGLASLEQGEDLYVRDTLTGRRRALGSIRSMKQCVDCHGGERGALLGAFSYTLRAESK